MEAGPKIAFIDDKEEELRTFADQVKAGGASASAVYDPSEITNGLLQEADLIVVDYTLDDWIDNVQVEKVTKEV